jgi:hypothetical protein
MGADPQKMAHSGFYRGYRGLSTARRRLNQKWSSHDWQFGLE